MRWEDNHETRLGKDPEGGSHGSYAASIPQFTCTD
jgi:hypothetical protein